MRLFSWSVQGQLAYCSHRNSFAGMSPADLRKYLEYVADRRLESLGIMPIFGSKNPFDFMQLQDVQELANFFERRVSAYQLGVTGDVVFSEEF